MPPRNPFAFLDAESPERRILLLLLAILNKQPEGTITLTLSDLTAIEDGASFHKYPDDTSTLLVLRFARRGAEAVFLRPGEAEPSPTISRRPVKLEEPPSSTPRHAIHDDIDLALREEEMAQRAKQMAAQRLREARAAAGAVPWRTEPPTH